MMIFKRFLITASLLLLLGGCGESAFDKCFKVEHKKAVTYYRAQWIRLVGPNPAAYSEEAIARKATAACNAHGLYD